MKSSRHTQDIADAIVAQASDVLSDYAQWYGDLVELSQVGFPGGGGGRRSKGVAADPTYAAANRRDAMRDERDEHDRDMRALVMVLAKLERRRAWLSIREAKSFDRVPIACETCGTPISGRGSDVQREGECPKCYIHRKRHGLPWPKKYATREEAARMGL